MPQPGSPSLTQPFCPSSLVLPQIFTISFPLCWISLPELPRPQTKPHPPHTASPNPSFITLGCKPSPCNVPGFPLRLFPSGFRDKLQNQGSVFAPLPYQPASPSGVAREGEQRPQISWTPLPHVQSSPTARGEAPEGTGDFGNPAVHRAASARGRQRVAPAGVGTAQGPRHTWVSFLVLLLDP